MIRIVICIDDHEGRIDHPQYFEYVFDVQPLSRSRKSEIREIRKFETNSNEERGKFKTKTKAKSCRGPRSLDFLL